MELVNMTPFAGQHLITSDGFGKEILLIVAKATYAIDHSLQLLDKQLPIQQVDAYYGEPATSSIKAASDLVLCKPLVDVVLLGSAVAEQPGDTQVEVQFRFGDHWDKKLQVIGKRTWKSAGFFYMPSAPEPIDGLPVVYELAFGGQDLSNPQDPSGCAWNPVGVGYASRQSKKDFSGELVPSVLPAAEDFNAPSSKGKVVGFGWIAGHWQPRLKYAGTYDEAWMKNIMPFLPKDFDRRFFNAAPADQQIESELQGGEHVEVRNMGSKKDLSFDLPKPEVIASACLGEELLEQPMRCDTVIVDADQATLSLVWRASFDVHQHVKDLHWCSVKLDGEST